MRLIHFLCVLAQALQPVLGQARTAELHPEFKIPESGRLREKVDFWIGIYGKYGTQQGLLHDSKYPTVVYEVLDFSKSPLSRFQQTKLAKDRYRRILMKLHESGVENDPGKAKDLDDREKAVYELYRNVTEPNKFLNAAHYKRIRMQLGQKDQFLAGMKMAGRYLPFMEERIVNHGVPFELSRLPYVESSFNTHARSKVGASGIFQFMRTTGGDFLAISDAVDERNDPIRASEAAAELLKINYDSLGTWPLAVTAYNHGRTSLMRAVRRYGTSSLETLLEMNKSRSFGFASSNFFACLLAAIEIDRNPERYFGKVDRERPRQFIEVELPESIRLKDLVRFMGLSRTDVVDLNPAFTPEAIRSELAIPAGYHLRLPHPGSGTENAVAAQQRVFLAGFRKIPNTYKGKDRINGGVSRRKKPAA